MKVCKDGHLGGQIHSQTFKKVKYFIAFHINLILIRLVLVYGGNMGRDILIPCAGSSTRYGCCERGILSVTNQYIFTPKMEL